eukprot:2032398-Amphidinium_carterae.1
MLMSRSTSTISQRKPAYTSGQAILCGCKGSASVVEVRDHAQAQTEVATSIAAPGRCGTSWKHPQTTNPIAR